MTNSETTEGMVKKEFMFIAVLIALVAGFLGGVIYSSFKNPVQVAKQSGSTSGGGEQAGLTEEQARSILQLEQEVAANPTNVGAWTSLGNVYYDTNQYAKSINAYKKSLELDPKQVDVWTDLGVMYRRSKQPQEALKAFDRAISLNPATEPARFNKGVVMIYDLNDKPAGIKIWEDLVAINPDAQAPNGQLVKEAIAALK